MRVPASQAPLLFPSSMGKNPKPAQSQNTDKTPLITKVKQEIFYLFI
jgi:hypothetical protein